MVQMRIAALMGLAAFAAADIDCGKPSDQTGPSDRTVSRVGGFDFDIRCHAFQRVPYQSWWRSRGQVQTMEQCMAICAADSTCQMALVDRYPGYATGVLCYTTTVSQTSDATQLPDGYILSYKRSAALNCKDKSSNGVTFTPTGSSSTYQIICDYQYGGNTLGPSKRAETFEQCVGFCDATAGCVDVVYSDAKYCWLKSSKTNGYVSPGWWSAVKYTGSAPAVPNTGNTNTGSSSSIEAIKCSDNSADGTVFTPLGSSTSYDIRCNFQYDGDTLGSSKRTETFDACVNLCDATAGCVDAIWSSAKYCWLKSSKKGNGYKSGGWYSAIKGTNNQQPPV